MILNLITKLKKNDKKLENVYNIYILCSYNRLLSKRADNGIGWELVAPSFYTGAVSLYAGTNTRKEPGHIDYGRSRLPDNTWMCVGTSGMILKYLVCIFKVWIPNIVSKYTKPIRLFSLAWLCENPVNKHI